MVASNFSRPTFVYIPRCCNSVAHELGTKGSVAGQGTDHLDDSIPSCMSHLLANDLASAPRL